jgi:hypothetical protein
MAVPDYQLKKTTYQEPVKRLVSPSPKKKKKKKQYTTTQALKFAQKKIQASGDKTETAITVRER